MDHAIDELLKKVAAYAGVVPPENPAKTLESEKPAARNREPSPICESAEDAITDSYVLRIHSAIAKVNGNDVLAESLQRAAELAAVPVDVLFNMQKMLRPNSASYEELSDMADELQETYSAKLTARMVRDTAYAYKISGMLL